jgi:bifunctional non-homologous end joining protein LigD
MLPTAGPLPTGPQWAYEMKWDGVRTISAADRGVLRMRTRHGNDIDPRRFPELAGLSEAFGDIVVDGELAVFTGELLDFGAVLGRLRAGHRRVAALAEAHPATVLVFDVLRLDGVDLRARPYIERRAVLESLALPPGWVLTPTFTNGPATAAASLDHGLEGVVAKKLNSRYVSGRSRAWIKQRHSGVVDATVIGWVRRSSGGVSLLLAEPVRDGWHYVGRCTAPRGLLDVLVPLAVSAPATAVPAQPGAVHWVRPLLLVEVTASSRTPDGRLRQARYRRARLDQLG